MRTMLFRAGLAVALAGVLAACGSSGGSKAEPILAPSTSTPATARSHTTTKPSATTTPASGTKATPSSADLDALTQFLAKYPDSRYVSHAKELQAKAQGVLVARDWYVYEFHRKREKWQGAALRLERILKDYPGNQREPEALYELANMYARLEERYRAQQALQQLLVRYPKSKYQRSAETMLAALRSQPEAPPKP